MKRAIHLIIISVLINHACAQVDLVKHNWNVTLKVVDEAGQPVAAAKASVGYYSESQPASIDGLTDTNGIFKASHEAYSGELGFTAEKTGYYLTREEYDLGFTYDSTKWSPTPVLVLKKIVKPISMYAKSLNTHVPDLDKPVGYDLMVGDWVGPYGKGINADILFTGHFDKYTNGESDFTLTVSFPNSGDGIQKFDAPALAQTGPYSGLRSSQKAPADDYQVKWVQTDNRRPNHPIETNRDPNLNYYFRVRTKIDHQGNIVTTQYGKIYGDFMEFTYYLNPTPNDRNVEFDPKQNLMKNLKPLEGVSGP
jgi:hypothetical protein